MFACLLFICLCYVLSSMCNHFMWTHLCQITRDQLTFFIVLCMIVARYGTGHVLVLADFPPSTRTSDLEKIFEKFRDRGVVIRWVNDTIALAVFRNPSIGMLLSTFHWLTATPLKILPIFSKYLALWYSIFFFIIEQYFFEIPETSNIS